MIRAKNLQNAKKEIEAFKRKVKQAQKDIFRAYELAKPSPTEGESRALEQKEKRFRTMKKKLSEMEESLKVLQEGKEPVKVAAWKFRRPSTETSLIAFCEA